MKVEEEENKPRPAANEEEAPQESADPPEAEMASNPPATELKRWARHLLYRKLNISSVWPAKEAEMHFLILATWWQ